MEEQILSLISIISWPGAIALIGFLAYKSGLFGAISKKWANGRSSPESDTRIKELEDFKLEAETNHFHQINELEKSFNDFRLDIEKRLTRIETHIFNGTKK